MRELFGIGSGTLIACACVAANWGNTIYRVYYAIRVYIVSTILAEMQKKIFLARHMTAAASAGLAS